jgi:hypothetical protein
VFCLCCPPQWQHHNDRFPDDHRNIVVDKLCFEFSKDGINGGFIVVCFLCKIPLACYPGYHIFPVHGALA